jgi:O-antigen ligase
MEGVLSVCFLALAAVYLLFALKKFDEAVFALPFFFPTYLWRVEFYGVPFTFVEVLIYVIFLVYLGRVAVGIHRTGFRAAIRKLPIFDKAKGCPCRFLWPLLLFVAGAALGTVIAQDKIVMLDGHTIFYGRKVALGILKAWIIAPILMFVVFRGTIRKSRQILKMFNYYTVSAILLSLWGLFQVITQSYVTPDARASGPFESANYLALYITPAVLYMLVRVKESVFSVIHLEKYSLWKMPFRRSKMPLEHPENFLFIIAFLILLLVLLFTKSYAAMMAVFASATFYFGLEYLEYYKKKSERRFPWRMAVMAIMFAAAVMSAVYLIDASKLQAVFQFGMRNSSSVRVEVYTIALQLLGENWLTGIGMGQFPAFYQLEAVRILGHVPYEWNMLHPHNLYLTMWLYLGLPGFVAFIWILYLLVAQCWKNILTFAFSKINELPKIRVMSLAMLLIILMHGCLDTTYFKNDLSLLFWMVAAAMVFSDDKRSKA